MFRVFDCQTANDAWQQIAMAFRDAEDALTQSSRAGPTREIMRAVISLRDPRQRWVASRTPPINPAFALAEVVWIMAGRNDAEFVNYFNRSLPKFAGNCDVYHGAYGHRLRRHLGIDQLDRAFSSLKRKPDSRQVVLQIWDGKIDLPSNEGEEAAPDVACNVISMLKVRNGALEWTQILRSNDIFRGLPYNFVQFTTLQEVMAGWLGLKLGTYNQLSDSLHVYDDCLEHTLTYSDIRPESNNDRLDFPREDSERAFAVLASAVDEIIDETVTCERLKSLFDGSDLPAAFRNVLAVLCAEGLRRRQRPELVSTLMAYCTNRAYVQLYDRWLQRCSSASHSTRRPTSILSARVGP